MDKPVQTNTPDDWRFLADRDLTVAEYLAANMRPIPTEHIAFLCQQAVEKYLKGVLTIHGEEPPYIHNLYALCKMVEKHRPSFVSIFIPCTIINQFAVRPRYDRGLDLSDEDMNTVLSHTKRIKEFLQNEVPELFQES